VLQKRNRRKFKRSNPQLLLQVIVHVSVAAGEGSAARGSSHAPRPQQNFARRHGRGQEVFVTWEVCGDKRQHGLEERLRDFDAEAHFAFDLKPAAFKIRAGTAQAIKQGGHRFWRTEQHGYNSTAKNKSYIVQENLAAALRVQMQRGPALVKEAIAGLHGG
jgi:hypothetical protein